MHRIGRTARAGAHGEAISFGCENFAQGLPDIEKYVGYRLPMEPVEQALLADITIPVIKRKPRPAGRRSAGGGGGRGGPRKPGSGGPRRPGSGRGGPRKSGGGGNSGKPGANS